MITGFNYFDKFNKEQLEELLSSVMEFQTFQALGLFLTKASWLIILITNLWNASMSTINKFVFGTLFLEFPFSVYLFRELGFNIGVKYSSVMIGVSIFVFILTGVFNLVDEAIDAIAEALDNKQNNKEEDSEDE